MRKLLAIIVVAAVMLQLAGLIMAQDESYALKGYMPMTVGSKWIMKTTGQQGQTTVTMEVAAPVEIAAQQATQILTKDAQGNVQRGSLEAVNDNAYYLFGTIRVPRDGGQPTQSLYDPMVVFPAKMTVGQKAEATTKMTMRGDQPTEVKMVLELAAVESLTVPKGTFENALKFVLTTSFGDRQMKRTMWYARGIGLVKAESPAFREGQAARVTELLDYLLAQPQ